MWKTTEVTIKYLLRNFIYTSLFEVRLTSGSAAGKDGAAFAGVTILTVRQQPFVRVNHYYTQQKSIVYLRHECHKQNPKTLDKQGVLV